MKKYKIGYAQGVFDLLHVEHLNLLNNAKKYCDYLIVGINSDQLAMDYNKKKTNIKENDRAKIVAAIKGVDEVLITNTLDKVEVLNNVKYDVVFIADNWKGTTCCKKTEEDLSKYNIDVVYLPYTKGISTTEITSKIRL